MFPGQEGKGIAFRCFCQYVEIHLEPESERMKETEREEEKRGRTVCQLYLMGIVDMSR